MNNTEFKTIRRKIFYWYGDKNSSLYIRSCGEFTLVSPDREKIISPQFAEIFWPIEGNARFRMDTVVKNLYPGNVWYYPRGSTQDFWPSPHFHYCWLTIAGPQCNQFCESLNIKPGLNRAGKCPIKLFDNILTDLTNKTQESKRSAMVNAFRILSLLAYESHGRSPSPESANNRLLRAKLLLEENCGNPELNIEKISDIIEMHPASLSRGFRQTFGSTIINYLIICRMKKAEELLLGSELPIETIAMECGFSSSHYFSRTFRQYAGVTPTAFRRTRTV